MSDMLEYTYIIYIYVCLYKHTKVISTHDFTSEIYPVVSSEMFLGLSVIKGLVVFLIHSSHCFNAKKMKIHASGSTVM